MQWVLLCSDSLLICAQSLLVCIFLTNIVRALLGTTNILMGQDERCLTTRQRQILPCILRQHVIRNKPACNREVTMSWSLSKGVTQQEQEVWQEAYEQVLAALAELRNSWLSSPQQRINTTLLTHLLAEHERMVDLCLTLNRPQEAWDHAQEVYVLARQLKDMTRIGFAKRRLGDLLTMLNIAQDGDALHDVDLQYESALLAFRTANNHVEVARTLVKHGKSLLQRESARSAAACFQQATAILHHLDLEDEAVEAQLLLEEASQC